MIVIHILVVDAKRKSFGHGNQGPKPAEILAGASAG